MLTDTIFSQSFKHHMLALLTHKYHLKKVGCHGNIGRYLPVCNPISIFLIIISTAILNFRLMYSRQSWVNLISILQYGATLVCKQTNNNSAYIQAWLLNEIHHVAYTQWRLRVVSPLKMGWQKPIWFMCFRDVHVHALRFIYPNKFWYDLEIFY